VQPTWRLFLLLLLAAPLGALGGVAALGAALLVGAALLAALADWALAGDLARLEGRREVADKLSLGAWNPVRVVLRNGTGRALDAELRDDLPVVFAVQPPAEELRSSTGKARSRSDPSWASGTARLAPGAEAAVVYRVRPPRRGDYQWGSLYLRATGPLGLVRRARRLPDTATAVRVYPDLRQLRRFDLLAKRGVALEAGQRPLRAPGASTEFERLREYLPDDEYRRINWKASARRGKLIVNQYEAERSQNLVVMIDAGRLMAARVEVPAGDAGEALTEGEAPAGLTKLDCALNAALLLAYVGTLRGDRVALLAYADEVRAFLPPGRGRRTFLRTVEALYDLQAEPAEPDHGLAFAFLAARNLRRSLVVLFTDLADRETSGQLVAHLQRAARHHLAVCVTLGDPTVVRPATAAPADAAALYEKMVAQRLLDDRAAVLATLRQGGVLCLDARADTLTPRVVETYLDLKLRGRV
jgi:uncharacterized protein (DUF58 family)